MSACMSQLCKGLRLCTLHMNLGPIHVIVLEIENKDFRVHVVFFDYVHGERL